MSKTTTKKNNEVEAVENPEGEAESQLNESSLDNHDDEATRNRQRRQRREEWGEQFHKWLIYAVQKEYVIEVLLSSSYPGVTSVGNIFSGIPRRVDQNHVQFVVNDVEVWVNLNHVIGCKSLGPASRTRRTEQTT